MKPFIYPEMMIHVPLCTHKDPAKVLIVSDDTTALEQELARHPESALKCVGASLDALRDEGDQSADVVLLETLTDAVALAHAGRILKEDGVLAMQHPSLDEKAENTALMQTLAKDFKIIMPYYVGNGDTLLLASKAYHPTADVILHRTDLIEGLQYYNCDIHIAAFAMPNYIRQTYLGVTRN